MTTASSARQRDEMFMLHQGLVRAIAWKTHQRLPRAVELDDLVAYGQIGLLEAIAAFDAARSRKFTTYAWYRIRGAMLDGLGKMTWFDRAASGSLRTLLPRRLRPWDKEEPPRP